MEAGLTFIINPVPVRAVAKIPAAVDAVEFARLRLGFAADERQEEVLLSEAKRGILNCSRQWGKSTVAAAGVSGAGGESFGAAEPVVCAEGAGYGEAGGAEPRRDGDNPISLMLPNGSRIVGVPGNAETVRGFSGVSMLLVDEAARVPDEMFTALSPMPAVGHGDLWRMSTPKGRSGFFYEAWEFGDEDWHRVCAKATECGRIGADFPEKQQASMDAAEFRQEYMAEFVNDGTKVFDREVVEGALVGG